MAASLLLISLGGAAIAGVNVRSRPVVSFAVLVALAAFSRLTVELPPGTMRLEQPAIAVVGLSLLFAQRGRISRGRELRLVAPILAGLGVYLAFLGLASAFVAPDPIGSLRIVLWHAISIAGGVAAFLLLRGRAREAVVWLVAIGSMAGLIGIVAAVLFLVIGDSWTLGVKLTGSLPRVFAIAWEANLYASFLGALLPFGIERYRERPSMSRLAPVLLMAVGLALALTRGAWLGLAAGITVQLAALRWHGIGWRHLVRPGLAVLACLLLAVPTPNILLPVSRGPATPSSPDGATPRPYPDTVGFRLARVRPALEDFQTSPLIGLGAESFGQRHRDSSQGGAPDHVPILVLALPYESGLFGAAGFAVAMLLILRLLGRSLRGSRATPMAAAFLGSIVSLLVAYQATNAIHFAINWLLIGAGVALAVDVLVGPSRTETSAVRQALQGSVAAATLVP